MITPRKIFSFPLLLSTLCLASCSDTSPLTKKNRALASCNLNEVYSVQFIGHAFGEGSIRFAANPDDKNSVAYEVNVNASNSDTPDISIRGIAQCLDGVVTGKFGGGAASRAELSVLGGSFEGLFKHNNIGLPFGRWQISLHDASKDKKYDLSGFWQEHTVTSVAQQ